jgi:hypothetical protein
MIDPVLVQVIRASNYTKAIDYGAKGIQFIKYMVGIMEPLTKTSSDRAGDIFIILQELAKGPDGIFGTEDDLISPEKMKLLNELITSGVLNSPLVSYFLQKHVSKYWIRFRKLFCV